MSMLSAQCDELRAMAESVGLAIPQAATLMMGAADTIWELRGSVHRERAEADGLRMRITSLEAALEGMHLIREQDMAENAKLRELVRDYEHCSMHTDCDRCEYDGKLSTHCPLSPCFPDIDELRELGVKQ